MLFDPSGNEVVDMPHEEDWERWRGALADEDFEEVVEAINDYVDEKLAGGGAPVVETAWITGSDWRGGPFECLYYAAGQSEEQSGMFAGLLVWHVLADREERWMFHRNDEHECMVYQLWD